jgi:hypothetical protein
MSEPNGDVPQTPWPPDQADSPLPNALPYKLTKPVNLAQLQHEIQVATDAEDVQTALVGPYPDGVSALWVLPPSLEADTVEQAIADHEPDPGWGVPKVEKDYQAVMAKLLDDPEAELSQDELVALVRGLAIRTTLPGS